jgi:hypothetical protein
MIAPPFQDGKAKLLRVLADSTLISFLPYAPFHFNASELRDIPTDNPPDDIPDMHAKKSQCAKFSHPYFLLLYCNLVFMLDGVM